MYVVIVIVPSLSESDAELVDEASDAMFVFGVSQAGKLNTVVATAAEVCPVLMYITESSFGRSVPRAAGAEAVAENKNGVVSGIVV